MRSKRHPQPGTDRPGHGRDIAWQGTWRARFALFDGRCGLPVFSRLAPRSERLNSRTAVVLLQPALSQQMHTACFDSDRQQGREVTQAPLDGFGSPEHSLRHLRDPPGEPFAQPL